MADNKNKNEGKVAKEIENVTADIPSAAYLWSALGIMDASLSLKLTKKDDMSLFVG